MVAREIASYLAGAGLGLTAEVNLFWRPFRETDPDAAVVVVDSEGEADDRGGPGAPTLEHPHCLVMVRGTREAGLEPVAQLAQAVYRALRQVGDDGHDVLDGTTYLDGSATRPPFYAGDDTAERPRYFVEFALVRLEEA